MDKVTRIGVSLEPELLERFDELIENKGYSSRSEAIRDLVRDSLSEMDLKNDDLIVTGAIIIVIDTSVTGIYERLGFITRKWASVFVSNTDTILDMNNKLSIIIAEGRLADLRSFVTELISVKGVRRGKLTMVAPKTGNLHHIGMRS